MHISSLPQPHGIGTFGSQARAFADLLCRAGQKYWQILPLGPAGYGDSPYQSFSSFALNPYFIDPDQLVEEGLLKKEEAEAADFGADPARVDYGALYLCRFSLLKKAFSRGSGILAEEAGRFFDEESWWLEDYALFMSLKDWYGGKPWHRWEEGIRRRQPRSLAEWKSRLEKETEFWKFTQFLAFRQWRALKDYVNQRGICIIGDLPIYAAEDSVDVWVNASAGIFKFTEDLTPAFVAGCPPDYFSRDGQYWGNPVFDWEKMQETDFLWWKQRLAGALRLYDFLRIDHFRGFESYWEIPWGAPTAAFGHWSLGPGMAFVRMVNETFGPDKMIAENLGTLTDAFRSFLKETGYPGMRVLSFAFDSDQNNEHLPHNYEKNGIVYTGTHDNDTIMGWWAAAAPEKRDRARRYLGLHAAEGINRGMIRGIWSSCADVAIAPMQDILGLGSRARMNTPSQPAGNWRWRMKKEQINEEWILWLKELTELYGR